MTAQAVAAAERWASALLDPEAPLPPGLRCWNGSDPRPRFDVHRNTVLVTLVAALADTFPVVRALVGPDFFAEAARRFVRAQPPCSPLLAEYGAAFPAFLAGYAPAGALPWLSDVARLEFARVTAFHAADAVALDAARLASWLARPDGLADSHWPLHPSLHVVDSDHPVVDLWAAHQGEGSLESVDLQRAQSALVGRDGDDVLVLTVPRACALFVAVLQAGAPLADAVATAGDTLDLPASLALLLRHGWWVEPFTDSEFT